MALILPNNMYLKIDLQGNYVLYKNKTARTREKKSTSSKTILAKYREILAEFNTLEYQRYHEKTGIEKLWYLEYKKYCDNLYAGNAKEDYPLMKEYFADVNKTIPEIITKGTLGIAYYAESLEALYQLIKKCEIFGKAEDIKDA